MKLRPDKQDALARRFVERMISGVGSVSLPEPPRVEFRVSSFPYCGILDALKLADPPEGESTYGFAFYTSVGTAIHESLQTFMPHVKKLGKLTTQGKWKCARCKVVTTVISTRPKACASCQHTKLLYEEVDFSYRGLSGHLDYLTFHPKIGWIAFEFKSTGAKYLNDLRYAKYLPFEKHPHQIETYGALLYLQYGIRINYYTIVYLARNDPHANDFLPRYDTTLLHKSFLVPFTDDRLNYRVRSVKRACASRKLATKFIKTGDTEAGDTLWSKRPCTSMVSWEKNMSAAFFGEERCPHLDSCVKGKRSKVLPPPP